MTEPPMTEQELDLRLRDALLLAARAEYAPLSGEEEPELPPALQRRMRPLLADPFGRRRRTRRMVGRAAAAAVLALSLSFGALMAFSPEARAWVQRMTVQLMDRYATIRFNGDRSAGELGDWAPTWLPEGYELVETDNSFTTFQELCYQDDEDHLIQIFITFPHNGFTISVDNEHHVAESLFVNGNSAYFLRAVVPGHESSLSWCDEVSDTAFFVIADLSPEELLKIAESLEKK